MAKYKKQAGRPWAVWKLILADLALLGIALLVFALFHHVLPKEEAVVGIVSQRVRASVETPVPTAVPTVVPVTPTPQPTAAPAALATVESTATPEPTPEPTPTPVPTPDPVGYFGTKFADKFTDGEIINDGNHYQSANVNVTVSKEHQVGADIYIADIYVRDISCMQTAFGKDKFGRNQCEWVEKIAKRKGAIVTINGDYYGTRDNGIVIRNGVLYRDDKKLTRDVCVLYWDGTMECFSPKEFNAEAEMARGAYQAWNFGPMLLNENGESMTKFNSKITKPNPRACIGYYEPGHYCLVVVDGRSNSSIGLSLNKLSLLFEYLGCTAAYNLDGGQTAVMACGDKLINDQAGSGRQCSDYIMVLDAITGFDGAERG